MADFRNDQTPPNINTTIRTTEDKSGSSMLYFVLGGIVIALVALWVAYSNGYLMSKDGGMTTPAGGNVTIENNAAPATPDATMAPAAPAAPVAPAPTN